MSLFNHQARTMLLGGIAFSFLTACSPVPDVKLTKDQKIADMKWLYAIFDENYAPLEYKADKFGLDYVKMKGDYMRWAQATQSNDEFYQVMHNFVAQFQDAHTGGSLTNGGLPNRAKIAYLGFSGKRKGDVFVVTEILPTTDLKKSNFPVQVGDEISMLDGEKLADVIERDLVPATNLGQPESNLTFHMNRLFNRVSLSQKMPDKDNATLTIVKRALTEKERELLQHETGALIPANIKKDVELEVSLPWVVKDLYDFKKEQQQAGSGASSSSDDASTKSLADVFTLNGGLGSNPVLLAFRGFDGGLKLPTSTFFSTIRGSDNFNFRNTFFFPEQIESWTGVQQGNVTDGKVKAEAGLAGLKAVRHIPKNAIFVTPENATYPAFVSPETKMDLDGNEGYGTQLIGTIFLSTFSPDAPTAKVVAEFENTLQAFQDLKVEHIIIDMINNGGGSLEVGMKLAQALSTAKVQMPYMKLRTSQTWRDEFLGESLRGASDAEKLLARRVFDKLQHDTEAGNRMTDLMSTEEFVPFQLEPSTVLDKNFKVVLLVNEMCASMCDIFSATLQDNKMAVVLGAKTMGAGGNVVSHYSAPNSHFIVRQTESLIVRNKKTKTGFEAAGYLENEGVTPDIEVPVSNFSDKKYQPLHQAARKLLSIVPKKSGKAKAGKGASGVAGGGAASTGPRATRSLKERLNWDVLFGPLLK